MPQRLAGLTIGLALSFMLVGPSSAQTPCNTLLDYIEAGDERSRRIYELRCGDVKMGFLFRPRVPKPPRSESERVIDTRAYPLVQVLDDAPDPSIRLADDFHEHYLDRPLGD